MRRVYLRVAVVVLNTIVVLLIVNLVLFVFYAVADRRGGKNERDTIARFGKAVTAGAYPQRSAQHVDALMLETWNRSLAFEPFTHFKERPAHGRYVNVDAAGFRRGKAPQAWPPRAENLNVFFFGGSTAFGYGVPDDETIPAQLQEMLDARHCGRPVQVYNFGRGFYYSSQERILFEQLLAQGHVPGLAIFLDGLNDFGHPADIPDFSDAFGAAWAGDYEKAIPDTERLTHRIPIVRAARAMHRRLVRREDAPRASHRGAADAERVIQHWLVSKGMVEAIGERFGVSVLFAVQPVAAYGYDLKYHPFSSNEAAEHPLAYHGYPIMKARLDAARPSHLLWLGDMQRGRQEPLYVDTEHYTARFSREIALRIAEAIVSDGGPCAASSVSE